MATATGPKTLKKILSERKEREEIKSDSYQSPVTDKEILSDCIDCIHYDQHIGLCNDRHLDRCGCCYTTRLSNCQMYEPIVKDKKKRDAKEIIINNIVNMAAPTNKSKVEDLPKHERMESIKLLLETIDKKNDEYTVDPISVITIDDIITQIIIKAIRARYSKTTEKRLDELNDIAAYSVLGREKVLNSINTNSD